MNDASVSFDATVPFTYSQSTASLAIAEAARRASYWHFVDNCCRNRRTQSRPTVLQKTPVLSGMILEATDRRYVVGSNGAWRRIKRNNAIPASKSQIRLLPVPQPSPA